MSEILLLNPRRKAAKKSKKTAKKRPARKRPARRTTRKPAARMSARKGATMARKKRATKRRRAPRRNPTTTRRRRNPSRRRRITRRASGAVAGLNFKQAFKNIPINTIGMLAAKWAAKRFGTPASETDPASWNYASYLKGAAGAAAAGFLANMIKRGTGQRVMEGGMALMLYKLTQNELIAGNTFWSGQLGEADMQRVPGVVEENEAGEAYILGEDYRWYPLDSGDMGDALVKPGPLGDALVKPGPLGYLGAMERRDPIDRAELDDMYTSAFLRR